MTAIPASSVPNRQPCLPIPSDESTNRASTAEFPTEETRPQDSGGLVRVTAIPVAGGVV